jgi:hypothetical protein
VHGSIGAFNCLEVPLAMRSVDRCNDHEARRVAMGG